MDHKAGCRPASLIDLKNSAPWRTSKPDVASRLPSRTPSPSGFSLCLSDASTALESSTAKEDSLPDTTPRGYQNDLRDAQQALRITVKNTFVHFRKSNTDEAEKPHMLLRCSSAPGALLSCSFEIGKPSTMQERHQLGDCTPCAYFAKKADGCRRGFDCGFCHLCPADELKNRKKMKIKAWKVARKEKAVLRAENEAAEPRQ